MLTSSTTRYDDEKKGKMRSS